MTVKYSFKEIQKEDFGKKILDFGCKNEKIPGAITVDIDPQVSPDIIHDFNILPYPFETNSIDKIYAKHLIEHLNNPRMFLKECYRILKFQGAIYIETPHFSNYVAYAEPEHKLFYSYFMFHQLLKGTGFKVIHHEITFHRKFRRLGIRFLANIFPLEYERFWTFILPAENIRIVLSK